MAQQTAQPQPPQPQPAPQVVQQTVPSAQTVQPTPQPMAQPQQRRAVSLGSLDSIISTLSEQMNIATPAVAEDGTPYIDPQSESKMLEHQQAIIDAVLKAHPRFHAAFNNVAISGNTITLEAPTKGLETDLNDSHTEICNIAAAVSGVEGLIELKVVLNEVEVKLLPVKIEDRFKFIEDLNPAGVKYIIEKFDLTL